MPANKLPGGKRKAAQEEPNKRIKDKTVTPAMLEEIGIGETGLPTIPAEQKIGAHFYKIIFPYIFKEQGDKLGLCDCCMKIIYLSAIAPYTGESRPASAILETLIHEALHAIDNNAGMNVLLGDEGEKVCAALAHGLTQWLLDNPICKTIDAVKILEGIAVLEVE